MNSVAKRDLRYPFIVHVLPLSDLKTLKWFFLTNFLLQRKQNELKNENSEMITSSDHNNITWKNLNYQS